MRETPEGKMEFDCPHCGANVQIGWKPAVIWACPKCAKPCKVPWPEDDDETAGGESSQPTGDSER